eukprot:7327408-Alexandrium_andersonii.AAC.1
MKTKRAHWSDDKNTGMNLKATLPCAPLLAAKTRARRFCKRGALCSGTGSQNRAARAAVAPRTYLARASPE